MQFDTLKDFSDLTGIGVRVVNRYDMPVFSVERSDAAWGIVDWLANLLSVEREMTEAVYRSFELSIKYDGIYVFLCPLGFAYVTSPVRLSGDRSLFAICGPMLLQEREEYIEFEISPKLGDACSVEELRERLDVIPVVSKKMMAPISEQLYINTVFLSGTMSIHNDSVEESVAEESAKHGTSRKGAFNTKDEVDAFLYRKDIQQRQEFNRFYEDLQVYGDGASKALIDELIVQLLFKPHTNIDYLKSKATDYVYGLHQIAMRDGMDAKMVTQVRNRALLELQELQSTEDVLSWAMVTSKRFGKYIFDYFDAKHASIIRRVIAYLQEHYSEKVTLEDVAEEVAFNQTYLSAIIKEETNQSFKRLLNRIRVERACELLSETNDSISSIAYGVGFTDQSYFTRVFKRFEGVSPYRYRENSKCAQ